MGRGRSADDSADLLRLGRYREAAEAWSAAVEADARVAGAWWRLGQALQWVWEYDGHDADVWSRAENAFRRAAQLRPRAIAVPFRLRPESFDRVAEEALLSIPLQLRNLLDNTAIVARPLPALELVRDDGIEPDILGLWMQSPAGTGGIEALGDGGLDAIELYQLNIENVCPDLRSLHREIRVTVLHEVGHHFGMDHVELDDAGL
jgi:predicted Zn-dependent protease with MMP-like domain